jgi:serine/threonine protein phosphatase PrpC
MVNDEQILSIVTAANGDLEKSCQELIAKANEGGGVDNVTVVLVGFSS